MLAPSCSWCALLRRSPRVKGLHLRVFKKPGEVKQLDSEDTATVLTSSVSLWQELLNFFLLYADVVCVCDFYGVLI